MLGDIPRLYLVGNVEPLEEFKKKSGIGAMV